LLMNRFRTIKRAAGAFAMLACFTALGTTTWAPSMALLPSCADVPGEQCRADSLNQLTVSNGKPDTTCTSCLQSTKECCDLVGDCTKDDNCAKSFRDTHACVIEGGPAAESHCKEHLEGGLSNSLYGCMRQHCGPSC